ncbi:FBP domain-containing protein [Kitasatospora griseola]|uniref:FBP domain-containing protein n=1 Tax=Kitasatospora griseola TaxID=2064 RepID=UPI0036DB43BA
MQALTEAEIRASFVNCTKGEASRARLPRELAELDWAGLDFLGWREPGAPDRGYLVAEFEGRTVGVALRLAQRPGAGRGGAMCSICLTAHPASGVALMTARRAGRGAAAEEYASAGEYFCSDLACPLYVRGRKRVAAGGARMTESLDAEQRVARMRANLAGFLGRVVR